MPSSERTDVTLRDTSTEPPRPRTTPTRPGEINGSAAPCALDALSAASGRYTDEFDGRRGPRRASGVLLAFLTALLVGGALALVEKLEYRYAATFQMTPEPSPLERAHYRKELLHFAWTQQSGNEPRPPTTVPWTVDSPRESQLRLTITVSDRSQGLPRVKALSRGFLSAVDKITQKTRSTPTEGERVLATYGSDLEQSLDEAQIQLDAALAKLPQDDPLKQRAGIRAQWEDLRTAFVDIRRQASASSADYERLIVDPEPKQGLVSAEMRQAALHADLTLQQDLKELAVAITEVKAHTLTVWRRTQSPGEKLAQAVRTLDDALHSVHAGSATQDTAGTLGPIRASLTDYAQRLESFRTDWSNSFADLRELEVDPYTGNVLDRHQQIRRSLSDFLFGAARTLSEMRAAVSALNESSSDQARDHVLRSTLVRAFQRVQNAHHQFEFAAGEVHSPDHFRLDAALKSARGLRRRTQSRMSHIEKALQVEALERSRKRRMDETQAAKELVERVRRTADETIDTLIDLQDELNLHADLSEGFVGAMLKVELAAGRLQLTQGYLNQTKSTLRDLRAKRLAPANPTKIEVVGYDELGSVIDWRGRAQTGGIGAALTLITVLFGQWWVSRR